MTFTIKRGDTSPAIAYRLIGADGLAKDISGYNDVEFYMRETEDLNVVVQGNVAGNVEVTDAANGEVKYDWQAGDTDLAGSYQAEWQVTYGDGSVETFPNNSYIEVEIVEDIQ